MNLFKFPNGLLLNRSANFRILEVGSSFNVFWSKIFIINNQFYRSALTALSLLISLISWICSASVGLQAFYFESRIHPPLDSVFGLAFSR